MSRITPAPSLACLYMQPELLQQLPGRPYRHAPATGVRMWLMIEGSSSCSAAAVAAAAAAAAVAAAAAAAAAPVVLALVPLGAQA